MLWLPSMYRTRGWGGRAFILLASGALSACSTTATITRLSGPPVEGDIVGGSRNSIVVTDDNGFRHAIPRSDIRDIDHPGNVHATVGGAVLAYGVLNIAVGLPECERRTDNQGAFCVGIFTPAVLGAGMILWGLLTHAGSVNAAEDVSMREPDDTLTPRYAPQPNGMLAPQGQGYPQPFYRQTAQPPAAPPPPGPPSPSSPPSPPGPVAPPSATPSVSPSAPPSTGTLPQGPP